MSNEKNKLEVLEDLKFAYLILSKRMGSKPDEYTIQKITELHEEESIKLFLNMSIIAV